MAAKLRISRKVFDAVGRETLEVSNIIFVKYEMADGICLLLYPWGGVVQWAEWKAVHLNRQLPWPRYLLAF